MSNAKIKIVVKTPIGTQYEPLTLDELRQKWNEGYYSLHWTARRVDEESWHTIGHFLGEPKEEKAEASPKQAGTFQRLSDAFDARFGPLIFIGAIIFMVTIFSKGCSK